MVGIVDLSYYPLLKQSLDELSISPVEWKARRLDYAGGVEEFYFTFEDLMSVADVKGAGDPGSFQCSVYKKLKDISNLFDSDFDDVDGVAVDLMSQEAFIFGRKWRDIRKMAREILEM